LSGFLLSLLAGSPAQYMLSLLGIFGIIGNITEKGGFSKVSCEELPECFGEYDPANYFCIAVCRCREDCKLETEQFEEEIELWMEVEDP